MLRRGPLYIIALGIAFGGCHSSEAAKNGSTDRPDSLSAKHPAGLAQNITRVEAVIDKKDIGDSLHYTLTLFVVSSSPVSGKVSLIEPEQRVVVVPKYKTDEGGVIDRADPRNIALLSVGRRNVGEKIRGTITRDQWGGYSLLTVETE